MLQGRLKPPVDLRVNYRGQFSGYCNYLHNGDYQASVNLNAMLTDVMTGCEGHESVRQWHKDADAIDRFGVFLAQFWSVYHHELIGHGLGRKLKIRGYSRSKDGHFSWLDKNLTQAVFDGWAERGDLEVGKMFCDVAQWILQKYPVKRNKHDLLTEIGFDIVAAPPNA